MYLINYCLSVIDPLIFKKMTSITVAIPQEIHKLVDVNINDLIKNPANINITNERQYCIVVFLLCNILN